MIRRYFKNPLLKGMPQRGKLHSVKNHETGKRVPVTNPDGPRYLNIEQLRILGPAEFDELNALLDAKNKRCAKRTAKDPTNPFVERPKKRTRFPGQHALCWYCGRQCLWGGNGLSYHLVCKGARERTCWNSVGFSGEVFAQRAVEVISNILANVNGFEAQFREIVANQEAHIMDDQPTLAALERERSEIARMKSNLLEAIADLGPREMFHEKLAELESREGLLKVLLARHERAQQTIVTLPKSFDELKDLIERTFLSLAVDSFEFGAEMKKLVPEAHVYNVRLCDGGHLEPCARCVIDLSGAIEETHVSPELRALLSSVHHIDLFSPPQRVLIREEAVRLRDEGLQQRQICKTISVQPKQPTVQKALKLDAIMRELGIDSPYQCAFEPPDNAKIGKHKYKNFKFQPLSDYQRSML